MAAMPRLRCENCGSTRFTLADDARAAVCEECGVESQDYLNTSLDDWGEESRNYQAGGTLRRRRVRKEREAGPRKEECRLRCGYQRSKAAPF